MYHWKSKAIIAFRCERLQHCLSLFVSALFVFNCCYVSIHTCILSISVFNSCPSNYIHFSHAHIGHSVKRSYCFFCVPGRKKCILVYWKNFIVIYICGHMVTYFISINTDIMGVVAIHIIISIKSFSKIRHC
jgi:hypothetical protein